MAKGSLAELRTQLDIANKINYMEDQIFNKLDDQTIIIGKMLGSLIKARSKKY